MIVRIDTDSRVNCLNENGVKIAITKHNKEFIDDICTLLDKNNDCLIMRYIISFMTKYNGNKKSAALLHDYILKESQKLGPKNDDCEYFIYGKSFLKLQFFNELMGDFNYNYVINALIEYTHFDYGQFIEYIKECKITDWELY